MPGGIQFFSPHYTTGLFRNLNASWPGGSKTTKFVNIVSLKSSSLYGIKCKMYL